MKTLFAATTLACCLAFAAAAQHQHGSHGTAAGPSAAQPAGGGLVRRGQPIDEKSPAVAFADVLREPRKYAGKTVRIEGVVERVCKMEGCWMQIAPEAGAAEGVRVTFDHKFSVPKDAERMRFRAEGRFNVKTLSKEEADHLVEEDGAKLSRNPDGTSDEVSFVATGVELWK